MSTSDKSFMITPGEFSSFVHAVNAATQQLLDDAITQQMPEVLINAYTNWMNGVWFPFFNTNESTLETIVGSAFAATFERAEALRQEFSDFRKQFEAAGLVASAPEPHAAAEGSNWTPLIWGGLVVVGLFGLGYMLSKIPAARSSSKPAEEVG